MALTVSNNVPIIRLLAIWIQKGVTKNKDIISQETRAVDIIAALIEYCNSHIFKSFTLSLELENKDLNSDAEEVAV